jgi:FkbM family methyltransferase
MAIGLIQFLISIGQSMPMHLRSVHDKRGRRGYVKHLLQGSPLRSLKRLLEWRVRSWMGWSATVPLPEWGSYLWLPAEWRGWPRLAYVKREQSDAVLTAASEMVEPGQVVVDAGANIGFFTVAAANAVGPNGHVLAVEPAGTTFAALERQITLNNLSQVTPLRAALGNRIGTMRLYLHGDSSRHSLFPCGESIAEEILMTTLDTALAEAGLEHIDMIKIDVEGAEPMVLEGATEALSARPTVMFAMHSESSKRSERDPLAAWNILSGLGYSFHLREDQELIPLTGPPARYANVIALHPDRQAK